ncbi:MAG: thioesterase family protein, partial [Gammaproteobacteria bacterium]|nr:thioesterase family protein [Gammaproteobacteria bacterium]
LFGKLAKRKWLPIVSSTEITFIKDIKPWQQCEIHSKMVGWDHKYFYIEQRFVCGSTVHAIANLRGLFVHKRKVIDIDELIALTGEDISSPPLPETIIHFYHKRRRLLFVFFKFIFVKNWAVFIHKISTPAIVLNFIFLRNTN